MRNKRRIELKKRLEKFTEEAQKLNRCLVLRRRAGYIYVGEAIKDMDIEHDNIGDFLKYFPIHQKYADKKPITLLDLVNVLGGFNKAVLKMPAFMRSFSRTSTGKSSTAGLKPPSNSKWNETGFANGQVVGCFPGGFLTNSFKPIILRDGFPVPVQSRLFFAGRASTTQTVEH